MARPAGRTARKSELRGIKNILVPVDFSEASLRALAVAGQWAKQLGASIHMVYVIEPPTIPQWGYVFLALREDKLRSEAKRQMEMLRRERPQDVPVTFEVLSGAGAEYEVCELAAKSRSDLIVMASHGWGKIKRALLGSTAERIVRHAPCPVLVVKEQPAAR